MSMWVYRMHPPHGFRPFGRTPLEDQIRNQFTFDWTSGGFIVDALIHNLDICCWAKKGLPVAAQGQGGRIFRQEKDQLITHSAVEYFYEDGTRMMMQTKLFSNIWSPFQAHVQGTKGTAILGEGVGNPGIYNKFDSRKFEAYDSSWMASAPGNDSYQTEHDRLFKAIRDNQPWNEMDTGIDATFVAVLGRIAVGTGKYVTDEAAWSSTVELAPDIANMSFDRPAPLMPDADGNYPQPIPGIAEI